MKKNKYVLELESRLQTLIAANQSLNTAFDRSRVENKTLLDRMANISKSYGMSASRERELQTTVRTLIRIIKVSQEESALSDHQSILPFSA